MEAPFQNLIPESVARLIKKIFLKARGLYYIGNTYRCPICEHSFRSMLPVGFDLEVIKEKNIIGAGIRNNALCPYCQSTDRDRLIFLFLKNKTSILKQKVKILHIGPEPSLYSVLKKQKNIFYITGTKYSEGIYYHKDISSIDLLQIPFTDGEFDMVICNHVLEHIIDDGKAMSEIFRVLNSHGIAVVQVPLSNTIGETYEDFTITSPKLREKHFGQFDHVRIYYSEDYKNRLENAGFKVKTYNPFDDDANHDNLIPLSINRNENLYIGYKMK
jgi:SAM-dependent methyltransferase